MNKKYLLVMLAVVSSGLLYKRSVQSMEPMQTQPMPELTIMQYVQQHGFQIDAKGRWDLKRKHITSLEGLDQLEQLGFDPGTVKELDFASNDIQEIPRGIFAQFYNLKNLYLSFNRILIVYGIADQPLRTLARRRELGEIIQQGSFSGLTNLEALVLYSNPLTSLPVRLFIGLGKLKNLDLGKNRLISLPAGLFSGLASLINLNLYNNQLKALPGRLFAELASLKELSLRNNQLTLLPVGLFAGLANLDLLELSHNKLKLLPEGLFSELTSLDWLNLSGNPLTMTADQIKQQYFPAESAVRINL